MTSRTNPDSGGLIEHVLADAEQRSDYVVHHSDWYAFPQAHSDSSLGFGGMAGQMITSAPTIVVLPQAGPAEALVYFGGRFGYSASRQEAMKWIERRRAPGVLERARERRANGS